MPAAAYAVSPVRLMRDYARILASCRRQGIGRVALTAAMSGKLMAAPEALAAAARRLARDGLAVFGLVYPIGHPAMGRYYAGATRPPDPLPRFTGTVAADWHEAEPLPAGWNYAVNEFGLPVFCCACPDDACLEGNRRIMAELAGVFDEIWYDDDFRVDGDQGAGSPATSTASCYCDRCLDALGRRLGRCVRREEILADQALHDAWTALKVDRLTAVWEAAAAAGREVNPGLRVGLMVRWGGEERDGIDVGRLLPVFRGSPALRAGEGHFGAAEYLLPESQVQAYLSVSHHLSAFPVTAVTLSETTYFDGMRAEDILKKIALALAAGVREIAYCPCVPDWVGYQDFLEPHRLEIDRWHAAFADRAHLHNPIVILRSPAAGRGDCRPTRRVRDRKVFPLFNLAGLCAVVQRIPAAGLTPHPSNLAPQASMLAVTGRTVWDVSPEVLAGRHIVVDGTALLEGSPLNRWLGIRAAATAEGGRVAILAEGWTANGLLLERPGITLIPWSWHDLSSTSRDLLLDDMRRVLGPRMQSARVSGDRDVFVAHGRRGDGDVVLLVNLTQVPRRAALHMPGAKEPLQLALDPDEIRLLKNP